MNHPPHARAYRWQPNERRRPAHHAFHSARPAGEARPRPCLSQIDSGSDHAECVRIYLPAQHMGGSATPQALAVGGVGGSVGSRQSSVQKLKQERGEPLRSPDPERRCRRRRGSDLYAAEDNSSPWRSLKPGPAQGRLMSNLVGNSEQQQPKKGLRPVCCGFDLAFIFA